MKNNISINDSKKIIQAYENIKLINKIFCEINNLILEYSLIIKNKTDDEYNLIKLLHHELMLDFSMQVSKRFNYIPSDMPLAFNYIKHKKIKFFPFFMDIGFYYSNKYIGFLSRFFSKILSLIYPFRINTKDFYAKNPDEQKIILQSLFNQIYKLFKRYDLEFFPFNAEEYIKCKEINLISFEKLSFFNYPRLLLVGSRNPYISKNLSLMVLKSKGYVLSTTHGFANNSILDEPCLKYSELDLASMIVEYSDIFQEKNKELELIKFKYRDAHRVKKLIRVYKSKIKHKATFNQFKKRAIYTPTGLSGLGFYFPYRSIPDSTYLLHWNYLLESCELLDIVLHPKSNLELVNEQYHSFLEKWDKRIIRKSLSQILNDDQYDTFLVDFISTTSHEILASRKKVIYIDMKLRKLNDQYRKDLLNEVEYITIDEIHKNSNILNSIIKKTLKSNFNKTHRLTDKYSLIRKNT